MSLQTTVKDSTSFKMSRVVRSHDDVNCCMELLSEGTTWFGSALNNSLACARIEENILTTRTPTTFCHWVIVLALLDCDFALH